MKKLLILAATVAVLSLTSTAVADDQFDTFDEQFFPTDSATEPALFEEAFFVDDKVPPPAPPTENGKQPKATPKPMPKADAKDLYHNVRYVDLHEMHPCAVSKVVKVKDPCSCRRSHRRSRCHSCGHRHSSCGHHHSSCGHHRSSCGHHHHRGCGCAKPAPCSVPKHTCSVPKHTCCAPKPVCNCCKPKYVYIKICVPSCGCERVRVSRNGDRITYDYGKYSVDIRVRRGYIVVDYQD